MIWIVLGGILVVAVVVWVAVEMLGGVRREWTHAPGGPLVYRLNYNSRLARVVYFVTTRRNAVEHEYQFTLPGAVLVAGPSITPKKAAHEVAGHLVEIRDADSAWGWVWRYITDGTFAKAAEVRAEAAGDKHYLDPHFQTYGRIGAK